MNLQILEIDYCEKLSKDPKNETAHNIEQMQVYQETILPMARALRSDIRLRNGFPPLKLPPKSSAAYRGRIMIQGDQADGKLTDLAEYMRFLAEQMK